MKGLVFNIQRYSIHDGPGIRTVVFLKGCPLHCLWCCNPESQNPLPELDFNRLLCQECGKCIQVCPVEAIHPDVHIDPLRKIDRQTCTLCGECVRVCPSEALRIIGEWMEPETVLQTCLKDDAIYRRSDGGVTLSGGEPLAQPEFSVELLEKLYARNIHTAIETSGVIRWNIFSGILPFTNLFLYDIKHTDPIKLLTMTGMKNDLAISNLVKLVDHPVQIILRVPIIPTINDDPENLSQIASFAERIGIREVHIMPFHQYGKDKYYRLGMDYSLHNQLSLMEQESGEQILDLARSIFSEKGLIVHIGG